MLMSCSDGSLVSLGRMSFHKLFLEELILSHMVILPCPGIEKLMIKKSSNILALSDIDIKDFYKGIPV